jgi:ParB/RepB/Spo0J family partition protein
MSETTTAPKAQNSPAKVIYQGNVNVNLIDVKAQVRKKFDENGHKELTESVKTKGIINPITLRPHPTAAGRFELVAGERRFRAAKAAGLGQVPAVVRELDDQAAALYQVEENIHRKDLTPIEESRGFKLLTQPVGTSVAKYTVEQLAQLVDKSTGYVYRALALLELPEKALEAIEKGLISPAHGHQILRVPQFEREEVVTDLLENGYDGRIISAVELRENIESQLGRDLKNAPFPKDKPYAGMSACAACPSNTGNQGALFDGAEKGKCMNKDCFATKTKQHKADFLEKVKKSNPTAKFVEYRNGYIYDGMPHPGGFRVAESKAAPSKGDYGVLISGTYEIHYAVFDKKAEKAEAEREAPKPADPKDKLVTEAIERALMLAGGKAALKIKMTIEDWRKLAEVAASDVEAMAAVILGIKEDDNLDRAIQKGTEAQCRAIVLLNSRMPYDIRDEDFKKLGVDVAKVKKQAAAEAKAIWDNSWGLKHKSVANGGSEVLCGIKGLNYEKPTEEGIAVPAIEQTNCPQCKAEEKRLRTVSR